MPLSGRCLCGGVGFEIAGPLGPVVQCHCSMCRRATGTAFATNASVRSSDFRIVQGAELLSEYESSPGSRRVFCSRCGSPGLVQFPSGDLVRVRLRRLDGAPRARPVHYAAPA